MSSTHVEVDKDAYFKLMKFFETSKDFGIGSCSTGVLNISTTGIICDAKKEFEVTFVVHQGPKYWWPECLGGGNNSLKYVMYLKSEEPVKTDN